MRPPLDDGFGVKRDPAVGRVCVGEAAADGRMQTPRHPMAGGGGGGGGVGGRGRGACTEEPPAADEAPAPRRRGGAAPYGLGDDDRDATG